MVNNIGIIKDISEFISIKNVTLTKDYKLQLHKTEHFDYDIKMTFYKGN